jgi:hypothetical protein
LAYLIAKKSGCKVSWYGGNEEYPKFVFCPNGYRVSQLPKLSVKEFKKLKEVFRRIKESLEELGLKPGAPGVHQCEYVE